MFKSKHQFISNYSVVTGLYLSNTCLIFSDFTKTPQNGKVLKGSDFSLFQVKSKQLSQNRDIVNNFAPEWHSRGQRFDPAYLHHREPKKLVLMNNQNEPFSVPDGGDKRDRTADLLNAIDSERKTQRDSM